MATLPGNTWKCSLNQSSIKATLIEPVVKGLLRDLEVATPKVNGFFAAATKQVLGAGTDATIYAVAQCALTVSQSDCTNCLSVANRNVQNCVPLAGGSSVDAGCFLRYSDTAFFPKNATIDLTHFLRGKSKKTERVALSKLQVLLFIIYQPSDLVLIYIPVRSSTKSNTILGIVGGVCILLLILALMLWYRRMRKTAKRGVELYLET